MTDQPTVRADTVRSCVSVSGSSMPKLMTLRGWMWITAVAVSTASAVPRISTQRTRHGATEAMSSTTNATFPLSRMLRNFWLFSRS